MGLIDVASRMADMQKILAYYHYELNQNHAMRCPFHTEKTASFKVYANNTRWHCFGCGADGDAIDFVRKIEDLSIDAAYARVNEVCCLGLPQKNKRMSFRQTGRIKELTSKIERERSRLKAANEAYEQLLTAYVVTDKIIMAARPKKPEDVIYDTYADALKMQPFIEYLFDCEGCA